MSYELLLEREQLERMKVLRRAHSLQKAVDEHMTVVNELVHLAEQARRSFPVTKKEQAELLGVSRSTLYRMDHLKNCETTGDLFEICQQHYPEYVQVLRENLKKHGGK